MICPRCNEEAELITEGVPAPHVGTWVCRQGHFCGWVARAWTPERAAAFVMPIGKYKGWTLQRILDGGDREYLAWAARNLEGGIARACRVMVAT